MSIRIKPLDIEVPEDQPFKHDLLDRQPFAAAIANVISQVEGPCVMAIDSAWGNGKTTFLRMLKQYLANKNFPVASFNAWETDISSDPFLAMSNELSGAIPTLGESDGNTDRGTAVETFMQRVKKVGKNRAPAMLRALALNVPIAGGAAAELLESLVEPYLDVELSGYEEARQAVRDFREALEGIAASVAESSGEAPFVVVIDELDRCRPSYAVGLMEALKHLFSVEGIVFVMAVNQAELAHAVKTLYGEGFDAHGYLDRFFDVNLRLPGPNRARFIKAAIESAFIPANLGRIDNQSSDWTSRDFRELLGSFFGSSSVSLRRVARGIHHLGMVYASLGTSMDALRNTSAVLMILRTIAPDLYHRFVAGEATDLEVVDEIYRQVNLDAPDGKHVQAQMVFDTWIILGALEQQPQGGLTRIVGGGRSYSTPLLDRYREIADESNPSTGAGTESYPQAPSVTRYVDEIVRNSPSARWVYLQEASQRIELLSPAQLPTDERSR